MCVGGRYVVVNPALWSPSPDRALEQKGPTVLTAKRLLPPGQAVMRFFYTKRPECILNDELRAGLKPGKAKGLESYIDDSPHPCTPFPSIRGPGTL